MNVLGLISQLIGIETLRLTLDSITMEITSLIHSYDEIVMPVKV